MEIVTSLMLFPQPEETATELEEDKVEGKTHPPTTRTPTNNQGNKPKGTVGQIQHCCADYN